MTDNFDRSTESLLARRALAEKATPGPWFAIHADDEMCTNASYVATKDEDASPEEAYRHIVALTLYQAKRVACHEDERWDENAAHIAANAPSTVIADIDEILRLRAEVNYWQQEARDLRQVFERMYARLKKEADWLAQYAANGGWHGVRVSREFMREQARKTVEES